MDWRKLALSGALAAGLSSWGAVDPARADLIEGTLSLGGVVVYDTTAQTINISTSHVVVGTGDFASFTFPNLVSWTSMPHSYANQDLTTGSALLGCGGANGGCIFETTQGLLTAAFDLDSYTAFEAPTLSIIGQGFMYLTGFDPTPGTFAFTAQGPEGVTVSFSATAVPGPIAGVGVPGLILACGALVALARRRRKQIA